MTVNGRVSINRTARLAGALYLGMAPFNIFGIIYVPSVLLVPGDPATTAGNIMASEGLFRLGIVTHLIGQTIFILLILTLYKLLEPVNKRCAVFMAVLALLCPHRVPQRGQPLLGLHVGVHSEGTGRPPGDWRSWYVIDVVVLVLLPNVDVTISQFTFVGELLFPLRLVFKGVNVDQWEKRVLQVAHDPKLG